MDFHKEGNDIVRRSCSQIFLKRGFLKKFAIFTGKQMCQSLFLIKLMGFRPATLFNKTPRQVFPCVHRVKILSTPVFTEKLWWQLFYQLIASCSVSYLPRQQFFNLTFSFGRNITMIFWLTYFSIYYFHSYFLTISRL